MGTKAARAPISSFIRDPIDKFLKAARDLALAGPAIVGAALLTVGDFEFGLPEEYLESHRRADRGDIVMPEIWVDAIESAALDEVARPILDVLLQAFDVERCYLFDATGRWNPRR